MTVKKVMNADAITAETSEIIVKLTRPMLGSPRNIHEISVIKPMNADIRKLRMRTDAALFKINLGIDRLSRSPTLRRAPREVPKSPRRSEIAGYSTMRPGNSSNSSLIALRNSPANISPNIDKASKDPLCRSICLVSVDFLILSVILSFLIPNHHWLETWFIMPTINI